MKDLSDFIREELRLADELCERSSKLKGTEGHFMYLADAIVVGVLKRIERATRKYEAQVSKERSDEEGLV